MDINSIDGYNGYGIYVKTCPANVIRLNNVGKYYR